MVNRLCVKSVTNVTPVFLIEIDMRGVTSILITVNYGVYVCSCSVRYDKYMYKTKHEFVYDSHLKPLHQ